MERNKDSPMQCCHRFLLAFLPTLLAIVTATGPSVAFGSDWPAFRGSDGQGTVPAGNYPLEWSTDSGIAWKTPLPGAGASCPVIWKDRIYLTAYTGFFVPDQPGGTQADLRRHLLCLDRNTGRQLWQQDISAKLPEEDRIRDHGFAASTPAVDDKQVVCFFGKTGVIAFDHKGKQLWTADVGEKTHGWAAPLLQCSGRISSSSTPVSKANRSTPSMPAPVVKSGRPTASVKRGTRHI
ncbi:MAG UNVERIFIED_CONTAM: PQQ-like beta-propeller repeat protein [Planctomycetaceae bacterium]